jgi:hypothetical protein
MVLLSPHKMLPLPMLEVQVLQDEARKGVVSTLHSLKIAMMRTTSIMQKAQATIRHLT